MWRFVVITLACAGCTNPDDILAVHGSVASVDPVEGQVVRVLRYLYPLEYQFVPNACSLATPLKEVRADAEGNYSFELFRVETRNAICFRVDAHFPSGSVAWSEFGSYAPETQLPVLLDWRAALGLDGGVLQFDPPVPWPDDLPPVRIGAVTHVGIQLAHQEQLLTIDGGVAWQAEDRFPLLDGGSEYLGYQLEREPLVLDAIRLEDFEGKLRLNAYLFDPDEETPLFSSGTFATRMTAGDQLALHGTLVPVSRGLACPEVATPCPLTDGELAEVDAGMINEVSFKLTTPEILSAVVLRDAWVADDVVHVVLTQSDGGLGGEFEATVRKPDPSAFPSGVSYVRISDGGYAAFRPNYMVIPLDAGTSTSRVTLQFPSGLARIKEVSLFGP